MHEDPQSRALMHLIGTELPWSELNFIGYCTELTVSVVAMVFSAQPITHTCDWSEIVCAVPKFHRSLRMTFK